MQSQRSWMCFSFGRLMEPRDRASTIAPKMGRYLLTEHDEEPPFPFRGGLFLELPGGPPNWRLRGTRTVHGMNLATETSPTPVHVMEKEYITGVVKRRGGGGGEARRCREGMDEEGNRKGRK
ncbi:hypothetical protein BRADI_3g31515v3 [Brachypodium distachyon]|uniref:Uncharacterized protein n=1 Tax=Brachypodium distachyon TaxID=15368 RepID=A0A0Q3FHD1_BRADI|nr:hypothetical protein BRADI_3g31515v3 [Brachypodium distachyon]